MNTKIRFGVVGAFFCIFVGMQSAPVFAEDNSDWYRVWWKSIRSRIDTVSKYCRESDYSPLVNGKGKEIASCPALWSELRSDLELASSRLGCDFPEGSAIQPATPKVNPCIEENQVSEKSWVSKLKAPIRFFLGSKSKPTTGTPPQETCFIKDDAAKQYLCGAGEKHSKKKLIGRIEDVLWGRKYVLRINTTPNSQLEATATKIAVDESTIATYKKERESHANDFACPRMDDKVSGVSSKVAPKASSESLDPVGAASSSSKAESQLKTDQEKASKTLLKIADEIYTSEKSYLSSIEKVLNTKLEEKEINALLECKGKTFFQCLTESKILSNEEKENLGRIQEHLEKIKTSSKSVLKWREKLETGDTRLSLEDVMSNVSASLEEFLSNKRAIEVYTNYHLEQMQWLDIQKKLNASDLGKSILKAYDPASSLIAPVQRFPRYSLFSKELVDKYGKISQKDETFSHLNRVKILLDQQNERTNATIAVEELNKKRSDFNIEERDLKNQLLQSQGTPREKVVEAQLSALELSRSASDLELEESKTSLSSSRSETEKAGIKSKIELAKKKAEIASLQAEKEQIELDLRDHQDLKKYKKERRTKEEWGEKARELLLNRNLISARIEVITLERSKLKNSESGIISKIEDHLKEWRRIESLGTIAKNEKDPRAKDKAITAFESAYIKAQSQLSEKKRRATSNRGSSR